jgi:hypothetical protein
MANTQNKLSPSLQFIKDFDDQTATLDNFHSHAITVSFIPASANSLSMKGELGVINRMFQLIGNFESAYGREDDEGNQVNDNATIRQFKITLSESYLSEIGLSPNELKDFFETYFVKKRMLTLPLSTYSPALVKTSCGFEERNGKTVPKYKDTVDRKNWTGSLHDAFDLKDFMSKVEELYGADQSPASKK